MSGAPHLVLVHGMWSQPWVWDRWRIRFQQAGFACTAITLPGHETGAPDSALAGLGIGDYVEAIETVVRRYDRPIVVGHSLGGLIAQIVATRVSLKALVLVCSAVPGQIFPLRPVMLPGLARHFANPFLWRRPFRLSRREADHLLLNAIPATQRAAFHDRLIAESGRIAYQIGFGRLNLAGSNRVPVEAITCPIRALAGRRDHIIPIAVSRRLGAVYRGKITYFDYDQHAHWMLDEPGSDDRCTEVIDWIRSLDERSAIADVAS